MVAKDKITHSLLKKLNPLFGITQPTKFCETHTFGGKSKIITLYSALEKWRCRSGDETATDNGNDESLRRQHQQETLTITFNPHSATARPTATEMHRTTSNSVNPRSD